MPHKVLMIAYHFPPVAASSGFLRTLKFAQYLPDHEIKPTVFTVKPSAYEHISLENYRLIDDLHDVEVHRCFAKDGARDFALRGKYFSLFAFPDRWASWIPIAVFGALHHIKKNQPDVIWATYPIVSALVIGYWLKKLTGLPLICDLRDPIWEEETYKNTWRFRWLKRFEAKLLAVADTIVFTSPGTIEKYSQRYPDLISKKIKLITNGFDSSNFPKVNEPVKKSQKKVFLHSGIIPVYERNPDNFFLAIQALKEKDILNSKQHEFRLRACGFEDVYKQRIKELGIDDLVTFPAAIGYEEALLEMQAVDALMVFQGKTCNWQIPAKIFEYMQAQRPVLAWVDHGSDTEGVLASCGMADFIAPLSNATAISEVLERFVKAGNWSLKSSGYEHFERKALTGQLAELIKRLV